MGPALGVAWSGIWARRLEWVVDQHLDRAEDEQKQLQRDFEAVLRQSKQARERKYDQTTISYLSKQLDTARETIRALRRWPFGRLNCCQRAAYLISISILSLFLDQIIFIKPWVRRQTWKNQSQPRNPVEAVCNLLTAWRGQRITMYYYILLYRIIYYVRITLSLLPYYFKITTHYYGNFWEPLLHITLWLLLNYYRITSSLLLYYFPITALLLQIVLLRITTALLHYYSGITSPLLHWPVVLLRIIFVQQFASITSPLVRITS